MRFFFAILAIIVVEGGAIYVADRDGYQHGCYDTMMGMYKKLNLKEVDKESLKQFCTDQRDNKN